MAAYVGLCMFLNHSRTPAPILTKIAPLIALDPPDGFRGVGVKVIQGQRSLGGKILKFAGEFNQFTGEFNRGHQRSFQGHHHISETPAPILTKLAPGVALDPPMVKGGQGQGHPMSKVMWGVKS